MNGVNLLKYLLLLSFIISPRFLVIFDAEKELPASQENKSHVADSKDLRIINAQTKMDVAAFEKNKNAATTNKENNLAIVYKKTAKPNSRTVKVAIPSSISHDDLNSLYDGSTISTPSSFGKNLHEFIDSRHDEGSNINNEYSHYLIDRLVIESGTTLSYAEKQEKIQYLIDSAAFSTTATQMNNEVNYLMHALATLPLGVESPQWRESWYSRLQQWPKTNASDHMEANAVVNNEYDGWRARVSDYQQVRAQLVQQLGDQQDVFKVAQEDLRNSYFTDEEVTLITITDNTIDLLKNINQ